MPGKSIRVPHVTGGNSKSFTASGRRLTSPSSRLVQALRELGDQQSIDLLEQTYGTPGRAGAAANQPQGRS